MKIRDLPRHSRPREKLWEHGAPSLKDVELLAILLRTGYQGKSAVEVARRILGRYSLHDLFKCSVGELSKLKGIGKSRAAAIIAAYEIVVRSRSGIVHDGILTAADIVRAVGFLKSKKREHLIALYLDARQRVLDVYTVSIGTLTESLVHPREVFAPALAQHAVSIALAHNHPSGDPEPSIDDIAITRKLVKAGELLDISLLDHVIIGKDRFVSLKEREVIC